jgi:hypothetical protein
MLVLLLIIAILYSIFFLPKAVWRFLCLIVQLRLEYAKSEPLLPHFSLDTHPSIEHCELSISEIQIMQL